MTIDDYSYWDFSQATFSTIFPQIGPRLWGGDGKKCGKMWRWKAMETELGTDCMEMEMLSDFFVA